MPYMMASCVRTVMLIVLSGATIHSVVGARREPHVEDTFMVIPQHDLPLLRYNSRGSVCEPFKTCMMRFASPRGNMLNIGNCSAGASQHLESPLAELWAPHRHR